MDVESGNFRFVGRYPPFIGQVRIFCPRRPVRHLTSFDRLDTIRVHRQGGVIGDVCVAGGFLILLSFLGVNILLKLLIH